MRCDTGDAPGVAPGPALPLRPALLAGGAALLVNLDTMVNIALPAIGEHFALDVADITWLVVCYVLTYACLLLLSGRLADTFGHGRILAGGLAMTTVAVAAAGLAPSWPLFLAARVLQGGGAALVLGAAPAIVTLHAPEAMRARALARFQLGVAAGFAIGPPLGGALLEASGWRWVFLTRAPLAAALLVALARWPLPEVAPPPTDGIGGRRARPSLDIGGTLGLGGAASSGLLALNRAGQAGWGDPLVTVGLVAAAALGVLWVHAERRSPQPAVDPRLFRSVGFSVANALNALANGTVFMVWLLAPYYLLTTLGLGTVPGGFVLAANPIGMAAAAPIAARLSSVWGTGRVVALGLAVQAAGLAAVSRLDTASPPLLAAAALVVVGYGVGLFAVPNLSMVMGSIDRSEQGVAGGLTQMVRTVGVVGGVALGSMALSHLRADEGARLGVPASDAATFLPAFRQVFVAAAAIAAAGAVLAVLRSADRERTAEASTT